MPDLTAAGALLAEAALLAALMGLHVWVRRHLLLTEVPAVLRPRVARSTRLEPVLLACVLVLLAVGLARAL